MKFFVRELDENPKVYDWDEIEPIRIFKPDLPVYHICLQVLDDSGETVLQESVYTVTKEMQAWERPLYKCYLVIVCLEIFMFW